MMTVTENGVSTDPQHYVWWFPGSPVKVHLDLRVAARLQERFRNVGKGISEQGLLFGRAVDGATEILDFEPASGRSVPDMMAALAAENGKPLLVGYYRSEEGQALSLNEDDLSLASKFFGKPYHVFLLIQVNAFGSPSATFFFHDGNRKMADVAFMEFPLDASLLAIEERDRMKRSQLATLEHSIAVPRPAAVSPPAATEVRISPRSILKSAKLPVLAVLLFAAGILIGSQSFRERVSRAWHAITASVPAPAGKQASAPSMELRATRQNGDLQLSWNRESNLIATATSALISIQDGNSARQILLDLTQLRGGSLLYSPTAEQILMQLTVITPDNTVTESVMVLVPKTGAPQTYPVQITRSSAESAVRPQPPVETLPPQTTRVLKPFTPPSTKASTPAPAVTPLNEPPAPWVYQELAPRVALNIPQATAPPPPPVSNPATQQTASREQLPPTASPGLPQRPAAAAYEPPVAITKIMPKYPVPLQSLAVRPKMLEIRVTIDKEGRVTKAEPVTPNGASKFFSDPAVYAARLWRFRPARRGDQAVESESVLQFVFNQ